MHDKETLIKQTASLLQGDIIDYMKSLEDTPWPPTIKYLKCNDEKMHESLKLFMNSLLSSTRHETSVANCLSLSYARDLIHGVTRGKVITLKHFLLGTGLHNITGQKLPIQLLSKLGHSIGYNLACEIETAEADIVLQNVEQNLSKLIPAEQN